MLTSALTLAEKGMAVFPCRPRDKRPATESGCKDATRDPAVIKQWWKLQPDCNIGIACGTASGVFVIDVDGDGEGELQKLEADYGVLPNSVEAITARGRHIYFEMPNTPIGNSVSKVAPHIDVRATGGYVLAPPSIHPSGRRYCWSVDSAKAFATAPRWLLNKIAGDGGKAQTTDWRHLIRGGVDEGRRNDTLARIAGHLLHHNVSIYVTLELLAAWNATACRPPLDEREVIQVVDSIVGREMKKRKT
jgi:hypothetical protein